jgi:hypothetical protein
MKPTLLIVDDHAGFRALTSAFRGAWVEVSRIAKGALSSRENAAV